MMSLLHAIGDGKPFSRPQGARRGGAYLNVHCTSRSLIALGVPLSDWR